MKIFEQCPQTIIRPSKLVYKLREIGAVPEYGSGEFDPSAILDLLQHVHDGKSIESKVVKRDVEAINIVFASSFALNGTAEDLDRFC